MIFIGICIFGFLFVLASLPFALRYESQRRKRPLRYTEEDWAWPDDPNLKDQFPFHEPSPSAPHRNHGDD
jgi:hypothetical protein